jgi:hypothetical protein
VVVPALSSQVALSALIGWFLALTVKHVLGDFVFQNAWMAQKDRATGWALPLLTHCVIHGVLTTAIVVAVAPRFWFVGLIDFAIHIAIDRAKGYLVARFDICLGKRWFWWLIGIDQALHHVTGFGLAVLLAVNL